jgi:hypothetical protein
MCVEIFGGIDDGELGNLGNFRWDFTRKFPKNPSEKPA